MKKLNELTNNEKDNILVDVVASLTKKFKGSRILANNEIESDIKVFIDTGLVTLNSVLGKGLPSGKVIEIYGKESSGKTTLVQHLIAQANSQGYLAVYVDGEFSLEKNRAKQLKMDFNKILYYTPETLEEAFNFIDDTIELLNEKNPNKPVLICLDSLAAFPSEADLKGEIGELKVGGSARINAQAMRVLTSKLARCSATLLIINQVRDNPGVMFGEKESTPGGRAVKFHSAIRLKISKKEVLKDADKVIGILSEISVTKNKIAPPFGKCMIPIYFNRDENCIDNEESVFNYLEEKELLEKEGKSYKFKDLKFTRNAFPEVYKENKDIFDTAILEY
ncbi:MAG TPA: ATPase domain-containing protein [Bacteroidales bacterium]|nr:ATPase domain-containing protein [Bacteroidales bacterium]